MIHHHPRTRHDPSHAQHTAKSASLARGRELRSHVEALLGHLERLVDEPAELVELVSREVAQVEALDLEKKWGREGDVAGGRAMRREGGREGGGSWVPFAVWRSARARERERLLLAPGCGRIAGSTARRTWRRGRRRRPPRRPTTRSSRRQRSPAQLGFELFYYHFEFGCERNDHRGAPRLDQVEDRENLRSWISSCFITILNLVVKRPSSHTTRSGLRQRPPGVGRGIGGSSVVVVAETN